MKSGMPADVRPARCLPLESLGRPPRKGRVGQPNMRLTIGTIRSVKPIGVRGWLAGR